MAALRGGSVSYERDTPAMHMYVCARSVSSCVSEAPCLSEILYRGTSLKRNRHSVGPYCRTMPRLLWGPWGCGRFLMSEVSL